VTETPLAGAPSLSIPEVDALLTALEGGGAETRFVGGVVRDSLIGRQDADIDLATTLTPDMVTNRLENAGIKTAPTGLAHGTVTAIVNHRGFEITTLRRDVSTDGRHADVAYTDDWKEDAARRDFTINAMSADRAGRVYDYFDGMKDLKAGRVRFVGAADRRVAEDYLRILRFFRFSAWYGAGEIDGDGLEACRVGVPGLRRVSAERIRHELLRLLAAPNPGQALGAMTATGVLKALIGAAPASADAVLAIEQAAGRQPDPLLRLAALAPDAGAALPTRLRLSRSESAALAAMAPPWTDLGATPAAWRAALHRRGREAFERRALLAASVGEETLLTDRLRAASDWRSRTMPVKGKDLIRLGLTPGPEVGAMMRKLEAAWIEGDFEADREALLAEAAALMAAGKNGT